MTQISFRSWSCRLDTDDDNDDDDDDDDDTIGSSFLSRIDTMGVRSESELVQEFDDDDDDDDDDNGVDVSNGFHHRFQVDCVV